MKTCLFSGRITRRAAAALAAEAELLLDSHLRTGRRFEGKLTVKSLHRFFALAICAAALALTGCPPPKKTCSAANCPAGCCDSTGACQPGNNGTACGGGGNACAVCNSSQVCSSGVCTGGGTGG